MHEHLLISDKHIFLSNFTIPLNDCVLNVVLTLRQGLGLETQGRVYRYKCRLYQPGSPSDKSDSLTGRGLLHRCRAISVVAASDAALSKSAQNPAADCNEAKCRAI